MTVCHHFFKKQKQETAMNADLPMLLPNTMPKLTPINGRRHWWRVDENWVSVQGIEIPEGFVSDLDSVPHIPGLFALYKGRARWAALTHDYLYATTACKRKTADKIFYEAMLLESVPKWLAKSIYYAVRVFGVDRYERAEWRNVIRNDLGYRIANKDGEAPCFDK